MPRCTARKSSAATRCASSAGEARALRRTDALPVALPLEDCRRGARPPGGRGLRAGARPRLAVRRRRGFGSGEPRLLDQALAAMIAVVVLFAAATWTRFYFMMSVGERVVTDLRRAVFDHLLDLEPAFFESARTGELMSRLTNDATLLQQVVGYGLSMFVRNGLMMAGAANHAVHHQLEARALRADRRAGDAAADPAARPARAAPVAPKPGPGCRRIGLCRRGAARDPHRAGLCT